MVIASRTPESQPNSCPVCGSLLNLEPSTPPGDAPCPHCGHLLWFRWEDDGDEQVIIPTERMLTGNTIEKLCESISLRPRSRLVFDLGNVQYLSSDALSQLINLKRKLGPGRSILKLRSVHPSLLEVFKICRMDQILEIE